MTQTLEEFFESSEALRFLVENLKANMEVYCEDYTEDDKESFMRVNLIMIRQYLETV